MCNAAYMRGYLKRRRIARPVAAMVERARSRARRRGIHFELAVADIEMPSRCPVLGIPLRLQGVRSAQSPSLDRLDPGRGYVRGNVRVISDRANRLKGDRSLHQVRELASRARQELRADYRLIADYLARETGALRYVELVSASSVSSACLFQLRLTQNKR